MDTVALTRLYVLVFVEHGTRRMHLAASLPCTASELDIEAVTCGLAG